MVAMISGAQGDSRRETLGVLGAPQEAARSKRQRDRSSRHVDDVREGIRGIHGRLMIDRSSYHGCGGCGRVCCDQGHSERGPSSTSEGVVSSID